MNEQQMQFLNQKKEKTIADKIKSKQSQAQSADKSEVKMIQSNGFKIRRDDTFPYAQK